jgi:sugar lactone lactonase YvrE
VGTIAAKGLIEKSIHLAIKDDMMYIGNKGNESVVRYHLQNQSVTPFIAPRSGGLKNPSGLAFDGSGYFYVASRGSRQILRYDLKSGAPDENPFIDELADDPEFIELICRA